MANQFTMPEYTFIGDGALDKAESQIKKLGGKALIVTGKVIGSSYIAVQLEEKLDEWGIHHVIFCGITGEPTDSMVQAAAELYADEQCDFIIGLGGGSPLDSAKAAAVLAGLGGKITDYAGKEITGIIPPLVLIPTTAGTGSETTQFTVITDTAANIKMLLKGHVLLPTVAVVDPVYSTDAPKGITVATGMDALTHAVEAYTSRKAFPLTDCYALEAIKKIFINLPKVYCDGSDKDARSQMAEAAFMAGVCINNSSVTIVHGMSRPIGALFHVPHGISNAMLISKCLSFAISGCFDRFGDIGRAIGAATHDDSDQKSARAFLAALEGLCGVLKIPTLAEYGIDRTAFFAAIDKMAGDAIASGSPANTIRQVTKEDIVCLYKSLWE